MKMAELGPLDPARPQPDRWQVDKSRVLEFLASGRIVTAARTRTPDRLDPEQRRRVPAIYYTDGDWVWSAAISYYAEHHDIPVDPELIEHARARDFSAGEVPVAAAEDAMDLLRRRSSERGNAS